MDAGDLIYILLLFFFLISGLFKKRKPKKTNSSAQTVQIPEYENPEDFDEWFYKEQPVESKKTEIRPPVPHKYDEYRSKNELNNKITPIEINGVQLNEEFAVNDWDIHFENANEARRAFIYSEIFQRKY